MTYKELDQHLLEQLDKEIEDMRQVSWKDLEKIHMLTSVLDLLWHPAMKERMEHTVIAPNDSYLKEAEVVNATAPKTKHHLYQ